MTDQTSQTALAFSGPMHAYDPATEPRLFFAVIRKRCVAFLLDAVIIALLTAFAFVAVFVLGVVRWDLPGFCSD